MGHRKSARSRSHCPQTHDKAQGQGQVQDSERLSAINSLASWRAPSMDAAIASGRNNRRGNENQAAVPQRRSSGMTATHQNKKPTKAIQNITKSVAIPQNGPPTSQSVTESTIQTSVPKDTAPGQISTLTSGKEASAPVHKPDLKAISTPGENALGTKSSTMANGKDFWLELRKQVTALQQSGGTAQGG